MSVIVARALPDVRDGLKPVHRRILYSMHDLGLRPDVPYVKSGRVVGDVMGRFHPHGDAAIYATLVRMAQDFSMGLQLVDGHGNFGTHSDPAAAARYTEARMTKAAAAMVHGIDEDTVDMKPNYDGKLLEPKVMPAGFPNLLVNGSEGIAVGMATKMPPHSLAEAVAACRHLLANPDATVEDLIKIVPAPDFPTGGLLLDVGGAQEAARTGRGSFRIRARTEIVGRDIIVTELPSQVRFLLAPPQSTRSEALCPGHRPPASSPGVQTGVQWSSETVVPPPVFPGQAAASPGAAQAGVGPTWAYLAPVGTLRGPTIPASDGSTGRKRSTAHIARLSPYRRPPTRPFVDLRCAQPRQPRAVSCRRRHTATGQFKAVASAIGSRRVPSNRAPWNVA